MPFPFPFTLFNSSAVTDACDALSNANSLFFDTDQTVTGNNTANADEYCTGGNIFNFDSGDNFSLSCWVKWNSTDGGTSQLNFLITKGLEGAGYRGWQCWVSGNKLFFSVTSNFGGGVFWEYSTDNSVLTNDQWHNCLFVFNGSDTAPDIYVDGSAVAISLSGGGLFSTANTIQTTSDFVVGARDNLLSNVGYKFAGFIDEVAVFNISLDSTAASLIYNSGTPCDVSGISGIQSWWRMGDDASDNITNGGQITDQVGSNNLTPASSPGSSGSPLLVAVPPNGVVSESDIQHWWKLDDGATTGGDSGGGTQTSISHNQVTNVSNGNRTSNVDIIQYAGGDSAADPSRSSVAVTDTSNNLTALGTAMFVSEFTISFWINFPSAMPEDYEFIFGSATADTWTDGFGLYYRSNSLRFFSSNTGASPDWDDYATVSFPSLNTWHHIACVLDVTNNVQQIYLNGAAGTAFSGTPVAPALHSNGNVRYFTIGGHRHVAGTSYETACKVSDFRFYDKRLLDVEIEAIAQGDGWP